MFVLLLVMGPLGRFGSLLGVIGVLVVQRSNSINGFSVARWECLHVEQT